MTLIVQRVSLLCLIPRFFLLQVMRFAKLNKPPISFKPPLSIKPPPPPQQCLKKISPPGGLIEDLRYYNVCTIVKATEQYFPVVLTVYYVVQGASNF